MTDLAFPYRIDARGRTAETDRQRHVRDLIELVLFTTPGERVMRPNFGANLLGIVFAPFGNEEAAALQVLVQSALQEHLRDLIEVRNVSVEAGDGRVEATVAYVLLETGETLSDTFAGGAPT